MQSTELTPAAPASLYDIEQNLQALLETADSEVPVELEAEYRQAVAVAMRDSVEKRNRIYQFLRMLALSHDNCAAEIERLMKRQELYVNTKARMHAYISLVIDSLGKDAKGKYIPLKCDFCTFSLRPTPGAVMITDEAKVPANFKSISVNMPLEVWEKVKAQLPEEAEVLKGYEKNTSVSLSKIGAAIKSGENVDGADLSIGGKSLQVR